MGKVQTRSIPYPWHALDKIPRAAVRALRDTTRALEDPDLPRCLATAAGDLLGASPPIITTKRVRVDQPSRPIFETGVVCLIGNQDRTLLFLVEVEPELGHFLASTLLSRPPLWADRAQPTPPSLHAAIGAFLIATVRRASATHGLHLAAVGPQARSLFCKNTPTSTVIDATLSFTNSSFHLSVWCHTAPLPTQESKPFDIRQLQSLRNTPLKLQVVAALSTGSREELSSLELGDAWLPGDGWFIRQEEGTLIGDVRLMTLSGRVAWNGQLRPDGKIVLRNGTMLPNDMEDHPETQESGAESPIQALAEVPVVLHVELGTVTLTAREWAALRPGDVVTTGRRIAERAILRVGGIEVARGELVDVEGELGVKILEIVTTEDGGM